MLQIAEKLLNDMVSKIPIRIAIAIIFVAALWYLRQWDSQVEAAYWPAGAILAIQALKSPRSLVNADRRAALILAGLAMSMASLVDSVASGVAFLMVAGASMGALLDVRQDWINFCRSRL